MHLLYVLNALVATVHAHALPASKATDQGIAAFVTMTAYENSNWSGSSISLQVNVQTQCFPLDGSGWSDRISSIKVPDGYRCRLWSSNSCNGDSSSDIYAPGAKELGGMNDKTTSFKCYKN